MSQGLNIIPLIWINLLPKLNFLFSPRSESSERLMGMWNEIKARQTQWDQETWSLEPGKLPAAHSHCMDKQLALIWLIITPQWRYLAREFLIQFLIFSSSFFIIIIF